MSREADESAYLNILDFGMEPGCVPSVHDHGTARCFANMAAVVVVVVAVVVVAVAVVVVNVVVSKVVPFESCPRIVKPRASCAVTTNVPRLVVLCEYQTCQVLDLPIRSPCILKPAP